MSEQSHAPGWRGRARRTGPVVGQYDVPGWMLFLERVAPIGCFIVAALALAIAGYAWGIDALAGHL